MISFWQKVSGIQSIQRGEVHIWRLSLKASPAPAAALEAELSGDELARADQFYFEQDRIRFIVARSALRRLLGTVLGRPPGSLDFSYGAQGKPFLAEAAQLQFNLSHSGDWALLAITRCGEIGVDVERIRERLDIRQMAGRFFSKRETEALFALDRALWPQAFFNCWTRKEAFIKAVGGGLTIPLHQFDVTLAPGEAARLLDVRGGLGSPDAWILRDLEMPAGYAAAVAVRGPVERFVGWDWSFP